MAKRRKRGAQILAGIGQGLQGPLNYMLAQKAQEQTNTNIIERQGTLQKEIAARDLLTKVMSGDVDPAQASQMLGYDVGEFQPPASRRVGKIAEGVSGMGLADLHNAEPTVRRRFKTAGLPTEQPVLSDNPQTSGTAFPLVSDVQPDQEFQSVLDMAKSREQGLQQEVPNQLVTDVDPNDPNGVGRGRYIAQNKTDELGALQTEASPTQKGTAAATQQQAELDANLPELKGRGYRREQLSGPLSQEIARATAEAQNLVEQLTRGEKVKTGSAVAYGQRASTLAAENTPDAIAGSARRAGAISEAQAVATSQNRPITEGEARASSSLTQLIAAHADLTQMENQGIVYPVVREGFRTLPGVGSSLGAAMSNFTEGGDTERYRVAANFFNDLLGYARSGVTVRPDEKQNFMATMVVQPNDSAQTKLAKQQARQTFIAATMIQAQRGAEAAGRALGQAISDGTIPPEVVSMLQITNKDFAKGFMQTADVVLQGSDGQIRPAPPRSPQETR